MDGDPSRIDRLRAALEKAELPALLVSQPESRRYLSGYAATDLPPRESAGYLLITADRQILLTDPRTEGQAAVEAPSFELKLYRGDVRRTGVLRDLLKELHITKLGFEAHHVPVRLWQQMSEALEGACTLVAAPDVLDQLRMVKDPDELERLRASIALNDAAFAHLARTVEPGVTELELAWEMENFVRTHGAEGLSFPPITVAGPNTAIPHAVPSDRPVGTDEFVLFDIGCLLGGYCSDMTRTVALGQVSPKLRDMWQVVYEAQAEATVRVRPGMTGKDVDGIARDFITSAGFGEAFTHGLGHGVGLEIHEPPWITSGRGTDELRPGMVFSIEPGVYIPGEGGVRIEDLVLLTDRGAEVLCTSPKKLQLSEVLHDLDR